MKVAYIFAGPNGAGKTTFATHYLPRIANGVSFINADLIAAGLEPFAPERAQIAAGRLMLGRIEEKLAHGESFAMESTLSGMGYLHRIPHWRSKGYAVALFYLRLDDVQIAIDRVRSRVAHGGHHIPEPVVRRRFGRSASNFERHYKRLSDQWLLMDASKKQPVLVAWGF